MTASYFRNTRNVELSVLDYLTSSLQSSWSGVTTVKGFQQAYKTNLPVVSCRLFNTSVNRKEIGNYLLTKAHTIIIDIFATSDGQRLDLADFILDKLAEGIPYYEFSHDSGDPSTLAKIQNGKLIVNNFFENGRVDFGDDVDTHDRFRHIISFNVRR